MSRTLLCWPLALLLLAELQQQRRGRFIARRWGDDPAYQQHVPAGPADPQALRQSGDDRSPPLAWSDVPKDVKSFALICKHRTPPAGRSFIG